MPNLQLDPHIGLGGVDLGNQRQNNSRHANLLRRRTRPIHDDGKPASTQFLRCRQPDHPSADHRDVSRADRPGSTPQRQHPVHQRGRIEPDLGLGP
jgi:hypothetical protein